MYKVPLLIRINSHQFASIRINKKPVIKHKIKTDIIGWYRRVFLKSCEK